MALEIPCPQCGERLKLPDRKLLGRKARCGRCGHQFVLEASAARPRQKRSSKSAENGNDAPIELRELAAKRPGSDVLRRSDELTREMTPAGAIPRSSSRGVPEEDFPDLGALDQLGDDDSEHDIAATQVHRTSGRGDWYVIGVTLLSLLVIGGLAALLLSSGPETSTSAKGKSKATARTDAGHASTAKAPGGAPPSPTHGAPITLKLVPMGARVLLHLRPAELWKPGGAGDEFRACLGPLGVWIDSQLRARCLMEPSRIAEVLIALIPVSRDEFEAAVVVRTVQPAKRSDLIAAFGGELIEKPIPHYVRDKQVCVIQDARTFAIAPQDLADNLLEAVISDTPASEGIQALLGRTDRDRHLTLLAELEDVRTAAEAMPLSNGQGLLNAIVEFLGDDVETVCWSLHLGDPEQDRDLFTEVILRNRGTRSPPHLRDDLSQKLARLPADVLNLVYRTHPAKIGEKKIVGRLPIMTKILEQSAWFDVSSRAVTFRAELPERAGPNLALGTLLTWNQTTLPGFGTGPSSKPADQPAAAAAAVASGTIAERLQKKIDVEFRDDFLYVAVNYIGDEIGVQFKLDGPGMKRVGVTQNEKQKFTMEGTPAVAVLDRILTPRKLVLIVDEQNRRATITSTEEAEDKKLVPFSLK